MPSRKIEDLTPETQEKFHLFAEKMAQADLPFICTCTYRSQAEQNDLYAQGRTKPGPKVTWTTLSQHTSRVAFDIVIARDGKPCWDIKVDVNGDHLPDYQQAGEIGESVGLTWGGRWKTPDRPHFQLG